MSKLIEMLDKTTDASPSPLGFGAASGRIVTNPSIVLIGQAAVDEVNGNPTLADSKADAVLVTMTSLDGNALDGLLLTPVGRDTILIGKTVGNFIFMAAALVILFPVFTALFDVNVLKIEVFVIALLTILGLATVGTMFAALSVNTRAREIMLPVLFLPIAVPILISAVEGTARVTEGGGWGDALQWIEILAAFDVVFIVAALLAFQFLLED